MKYLALQLSISVVSLRPATLGGRSQSGTAENPAFTRVHSPEDPPPPPAHLPHTHTYILIHILIFFVASSLDAKPHRTGNRESKSNI